MKARAHRWAPTGAAFLAAAGLCAAGACDGGENVKLPPGPTVSDATAGDVVVMADGASVDATSDGADASSDAAAPGDASDAAADRDAAPVFDAGPCGAGPQGEPAGLKCTGLYADWTSKTVAPGVIAYTPGLAFWSDGAEKTRWLALPPGTRIDTSNMDEWTFPVGTKIWKEFRLPVGDASAPVRIETRLLWKKDASSWVRTTYRWTADGETDAPELLTGELDANGAGYEVPTQNACDTCHVGRLDGVLGIEAVALSAPGATGITMASLVDAGLVTQAPSSPLVVPGDAVAAAALGWLHMNCGTACHNPNGIAMSTGFKARLDVATLGSVQSTNAYVSAWNQVSGGFIIPDASTTYLIHACDVPSSAVYYRPSIRTGVNGGAQFVQMPPIDTHVADTVDLAALAAWIDEGCDGG